MSTAGEVHGGERYDVATMSVPGVRVTIAPRPPSTPRVVDQPAPPNEGAGGPANPARVVLVRCPQLMAKWVSAGYALPPIGLAYVAASLRSAGHDVRVIDAIGEAIDQLHPADAEGVILRRGLTDGEIIERIGRADVIGFSLMFSQDWLETRRLIAAVREAFPSAVLIAGGEHVSAEPRHALDTSALDYVLTGEGDRSVCELMEHLRGDRPIEEVGGCWYRFGDEVRSTGRSSRQTALDDLPRPAWDLIPIDAYLDGGHMVSVDRGRSLPILATRGCPYRCTFCSSPDMWTTRYVVRSPANVVAEMEALRDTYGVTNFEFVDLTAIVRKSWTLEFTRLLIERDVGITWQLPSGTRSEALDDEVIRAVVASGCTNLTFAPESGDPAVLERVNKRVDLDRMLTSMRSAVEAGCNVKANLIIGLPGETVGSILRSFRFLARMARIGVHDISLAPLKPYPGSALFRELQERGELPDPPDDDFYRGMVYGAENVPFVMAPPRSYAEAVSDRQLELLRVLALVVFFAVSWITHPVRPFRVARAVVTGRQESRLDKSLIELLRRVRGRDTGRAPGPPRRTTVHVS